MGRLLYGRQSKVLLLYSRTAYDTRGHFSKARTDTFLKVEYNAEVVAWLDDG